ncbi:MAG: DUF192 domain-containing protein [Leptothrix sp. (in: b-proteobacteria)]
MIQIKNERPLSPRLPSRTPLTVGWRLLAAGRSLGLAVALLLSAPAWLAPQQAQAQEAAQKLAAIQLTAGMHLINAEVAQTPAQREIGLMHRKTMPANEGMLFVFERREMACFWMRNTLLPLSIAFLDDDGEIVNIDDMAPQTETSHCPRVPVRYALEMNQGWFAKRGIKAGTPIGGALFTKR